MKSMKLLFIFLMAAIWVTILVVIGQMKGESLVLIYSYMGICMGLFYVVLPRFLKERKGRDKHHPNGD